MAVTNNITLFSDTATEYFNATELAEPTNTTHTGAVLNNRLNYKSYNSFAKTVSTICAGLAEFLATYGGIASGTMNVDTDLMTWTNYMQALTTDNKMANAVNAVTPLAVSGTTTNTKSTTGHTHSLTMGAVESGNQNPISGNAAFNYAVSLNTNQNISGAKYFTNTTNDLKNLGQTVNSGMLVFASGAGTELPTSPNADSVVLSYVGRNTNSAQLMLTHSASGNLWVRSKLSGTWGDWAKIPYPKANGQLEYGNNAVANANNAVQLGTGTNNTANTMQFLDKQVLATNFSKLKPSTANGWTQANQGTTLNVDDGLYLIQLSTGLGNTDSEIVEITNNTFSHLFSDSSFVSQMSFFKFSASIGSYNLIRAVSSGSNFTTQKISEFTYWYKKLV